MNAIELFINGMMWNTPQHSVLSKVQHSDYNKNIFIKCVNSIMLKV